MAHPGGVGRSGLRPGGDGEGTAALLVGLLDEHLDPYGAFGGQGERHVEHQRLDALTACLVTGAHGELDEGGARQHRGAGHGVAGEPGLRAE